MIDLSTNDVPGPANESGQTLTYSVVTSPSSGQVDCTPQGSCTYTPDTGTFGPDGFTYEVCDDGTTNGSPDPRCTQATVSVTVEEVLETLTIDDASVSEGNSGTTPLTFAIHLDEPATGPVSVHVATENGSATAPSDFAAVSTDVTIPRDRRRRP